MGYQWYNINKYCFSIRKNGSKISFKGTFEVNEAYSARTILISKSFQLQKKIFFEYIEGTTVLYLINAWNWLGHPETWWIYYFTSYGIFIYFLIWISMSLLPWSMDPLGPLGGSCWEICWFLLGADTQRTVRPDFFQNISTNRFWYVYPCLTQLTSSKDWMDDPHHSQRLLLYQRDMQKYKPHAFQLKSICK